MQPIIDTQQFNDPLEQWQELDGLALLAERRLSDVSTLCGSPAAAALVQDAFEKRRTADGYLLQVLAARRDRGSEDLRPRGADRSRHGALEAAPIL